VAASLIGAGREAEILAWKDGRVLRLIGDPDDAKKVDYEAAALRAAAQAGVSVPQVYERVVVDGRPGIVMERVQEHDVLRRVERQPWTVRSVGRKLGQLHARIHLVRAPRDLPKVRERVVEMLRSPLVPDDVRVAAERQLLTLGEGDRLCHGDFHPGNVLGGCVIDWTAAAVGEPAADVARTCVLLAAAETPGERSVWKRMGEGLVRFHLVDAYLRAYRRAPGLDVERVERWLPVLAAARLAEDIEEERDSMLRLARSRGKLRLPRRLALDATQRRWVFLSAVLITAVHNLLINAGMAWVSTTADEPIPLWSTPLVGGPSTITDTVGTLFLLPLITCVLVTTALRRGLAAGRITGRVDLLNLLPRNRFLRGVLLGAVCVATLAPVAIVALLALDFGDVSPATFVAYKAALGVALGVLVTPFIALGAMNDAYLAAPEVGRRGRTSA
jgi:aminoglycoside phosphotransferase (APT) family kinase protein